MKKLLSLATVLLFIGIGLVYANPPGTFQPLLLNTVASPSITFNTNTSDGTNQTTYTFAGQSFGTEAGTRQIIFCLAGLSTAPASITWSSVTAGGVSATLAKNQQNASGSTAAIFSALVPTGTTGTIQATASVTMAAVGLGVWSAYNLTSGTAVATNGSTASTASLDLNVNLGDVGVICGYNNDAAPTASATGYTERYDNNTGGEGRTDAGGDFTAAVAATPRTITLTWSLPSTTAAASASFR